AGGAHAAADAHGDDRALGVPAPPLDQNVPGHARAAHAERMANGNRATVDVEPVRGNPEPIAAVEHLAGKRLVELPQIDVCLFRPGALQKLGTGKNRTDSIPVGPATDARKAAKRAERLEPVLGSGGRAHQDAGRGTVGELTRIARRNEAALAHRLE